MTTLFRSRGSVLGLLVALAAGVSCDEPPRQPPEYTAYRSLMLAKSLDVEVVADPALERTVRAAAERYARATAREVRTVAPGHAAADGVRLLIGLPETRGAAAILQRLGATVVEGGFRLACAPELAPVDTLVGTVEDPERPGRPVTLVCSPDPAELQAFAHPIAFAWRGGLRAWRRGDLVLEARLAPDGEVQELDRLDALRATRASGGRLEEEGFSIRVAPDTPNGLLRNWFRAGIASRREVADLFGAEEPPPVEVQTWAHAEDLHRATRASELSRVNPVTGAVDALVARGMPHDAGYAVARSVAVRLGGRPAQDWMLDGIAASTVSSWWGKPKGLWLAGLVDGDLVPPLETLIDPLARVSPHVLVPLRGTFFKFLVQRFGEPEVLRMWRGERELAIDEELQSGFTDTLATLRQRRFEALQVRRGERLGEILHRPQFRKGVNLLAPSEPGYLRGFGTRACERSLDHLVAIGANSVALDFRGVAETGPEGFAMQDPDHGAAFLVGDLELVATAAAARARGMTTMFKPEILARPSGIRMADVAAESPGDAWQFFEQSRRFLVHAALLAELCDSDLLCIGTELRHVTVTLDPELPEFMRENLGAWTELIAALRGSFMGGLTYSADWHGEADGIEFWPQLDFVGMDLYPALGVGANRDRPDDDEAALRLQSALRMLVVEADQRFRPALICEIGFPATSRAWIQPDAALGTPDLDEQARLYRVLQRVFAEQELTREMFEGLYLWSWSTDPDAGGEAGGFTPQHRPALEAVADLFAEL